MNVAAILSVFGMLLQGPGALTEEAAYDMIAGNNDIVLRGYEKYSWISNEMLWFQVMHCKVRGFDTVGTIGVCSVCSIDDVAGQEYRQGYMAYQGPEAPTSAVAITVSRAHFFRDFDGWQLSDFEPFGANYIASNRHPYLRNNLDNLTTVAPEECAQMEDLSEVTVRG